MSDTEKDVSCFSVDGVVAEMVIEVEENQKTGSDDFKDLSSSPDKESSDKKIEDYVAVEEEPNKQAEILDPEKKDDKENCVKISDADDKHEKIEDKKSDEMKSQNIKDNQNLKRKRNIEFTVNGSDTDKEIDMPRYPGRKRLANKRYISEDMITSKPKISESLDLKDSDKGIKRRKTEINSKEKEEIKATTNDKLSRKSGRNKEHNMSIIKEADTTEESNKNILNKSLRNKNADIETEKETTKQDVLRKLPFRKNKDAPDVPDLEPKVFWWNGVGEGEGVRLGDIPEIRQRIEKAKSMRALYRVLFFQWPSNGQDLVGQILQFNGFPFNKSSYEFSKRQSLMKIMLDNTISHMCELLDLRKIDKSTNIKNILNFLLKPYAKIDPAQDPSLQPVVVLERIELDDKYFNHCLRNMKLRRGRKFNSSKNLKGKVEESSYVTSTRTTRNSAPKIEIVQSTDAKVTPEKPKEDSKTNKTKLSTLKEPNRTGLKAVNKQKTPNLKDIKLKSASGTKDAKVKVVPEIKDTKIKTITSKHDKTKVTPTVKESRGKTMVAKNIDKSSRKEEKPKPEDNKSIVSNKLKSNKKLQKKKKIDISNKKVSEKKDSDNELRDHSDKYEIEMTVDSGPDLDDKMKDIDEPEKTQLVAKEKDVKTAMQESKVTLSTIVLSDSSETESAEETKLVTASRKVTKIPMKRKGKPLRHFSKIGDSIQKANFSALQRLHILLFGASDKAENLKTNILSFGGFPFLEGSDEWKQKHFLLSLLAQNNLREYLNLLCIKYTDDDQPAMIDKLMRFLAVPSEESLENKIQPIETEVVSSELIDKSSPVSTKGKVETKKKVKKKDDKKLPGPRKRKVLMSEEEARRLEASFAREQRAIARENRTTPFPLVSQTASTSSLSLHQYSIQPKPAIRPAPMKPPTADPNQLNALLQTVYKRRALKAAGAVISTPNKGEKTKLGDIENIKFLIVTSNLPDLEILHRLIFMLEASKSRIRKNILDFDGFGFNEDSTKYKHRMDYLISLGYEASKRISFLLGLCPLQTDIPQQDLNELIMYFLMSPCKTKQVVPITEMPSDEPHIIVKSTAPIETSLYFQKPSLTISSVSSNSGILRASTEKHTIQHSTPVPKTGKQKARKSFPSGLKASPVKKILLPPSQSPVLGVASVGNKPQKMTLLNSVPAVPAYSLPKSLVNNSVTLLNTSSLTVLNAPKSPANSLLKVPVMGPSSKVQVLNQGSGAKFPATTLPNASGQVLQNQILIPQIPNKGNVQPAHVQVPLIQGSKSTIKPPAGFGSPQEFLVQQQTPDGQQKTFKLIRLAPNNPFISSTGKPSAQQTVSSPQQQVIVTNAPLTGNLPPGLIIMKNNPVTQPLQNLPVLPNAPVKILPFNTNSSVSSSQSQVSIHHKKEIVSQDGKESSATSANCSVDNFVEITSSPNDNPPADEDLFISIQEVILSSNFEDITLRNVIERVAAQFPNHDLTHRYNYMKDCVKKIIMGTT